MGLALAVIERYNNHPEANAADQRLWPWTRMQCTGMVEGGDS
ncbi:hypothetical protein [Paenibacillus sp. CAA11]|nr:hypothetical protein [Paenibacillus sp. CAA11]